MPTSSAGSLRMRDGQQPALQARRLLGQDLGRPQLLAHAVGLAALDGVEDRAPEAVAVDAALDEVVLRAGGDRLDAALVVAVAGEDEMGDVRRRLAQALERVQAARVGQPEVEQDAVEGLRAQEVEALVERLRAAYLHRRGLLAQQLGDQEGVAVVILDQQHANGVARGQACVRWSGRGRRGHGEDAGPGAQPIRGRRAGRRGWRARPRERPAARVALPRRRTARRRRGSRTRRRWQSAAKRASPGRAR